MYDINPILRNSARKFLDYIHRDVQKKYSIEHNLRNLSHTLKVQILTEVYLKYLKRVKFMR